MSNDNHRDEKDALSRTDAFGQVKDYEVQGKRVPLEPMEAMAFAKEYIRTLNETN